MLKINQIKIGIIGLGYVGLPLAVEFSKKFRVTGYDKSNIRIKELKNFIDATNEVKKNELKAAKNLSLTNQIQGIKNCNFIIVTVPTPINNKNKPDLKYLLQASKDIGKWIKKRCIIVYESTVYPGTTEEICIPIIEKYSKMKINKDFFVGYSPERINPGDGKHTIKNIKKITSASNAEALNIIDNVYKKIVKVGTFRTSSIKEAEAAKVFENTQRDLNIALVNEFSIILNLMNIDTSNTLRAAATKWNFMKFTPGLVGGHCIGVDPYYLTFKAKELGYNPKVILAGRKINEYMPEYVAKIFLGALSKKYKKNTKFKLLIMGITFKENCPDVRNSKVINLINSLKLSKSKIDVFDPIADGENLYRKNKLKLITQLENNYYNGIILCVPHEYFLRLGIKKIKKSLLSNGIFYDLKSAFNQSESDFRL